MMETAGFDASNQELALGLWSQGRYADLKRHCELLLQRDPQDHDVLTMLGVTCAVTRDLAGAERCFRRAIALRPSAQSHFYLSQVLKDTGHLEAALEHALTAVHLQPAYVAGLNNLGLVLARLGRLHESAERYREALAIQPEAADIHYNLGNALRQSGQLDAALASFRRATALRPSLAEAHNNSGALLLEAGDAAAALPCLQAAIHLKPQWSEGHVNMGSALLECGECERALASFRCALKLDPGNGIALARSILARLTMGDWTSVREDIAKLKDHLDQAPPFAILGIADDPADLLACNRAYSHRHFNSAQPGWHGPTYQHDKIRVAYVSGDFHTHATAYLIPELIELHDRRGFEIIGISFGPDDASQLRARLRAGFDEFVDMRQQSDSHIAAWMRARQIDIAVDLKGYTRGSRSGIFALRPAPLQISYLGYPSTMGAGMYDYLVADTWVVPPSHAQFYTEQLVYLPDCYQVNDRKREIAATPQRADEHLPNDAFVFCSFNSTWKINAATFASWMRILKAVDKSVLWLMEHNRWVIGNLRREAAQAGVDSRRLVFARFAPHPQHLARHRLADLFLDTLPCGAHTTASDALWAGLPVLTCAGNTFAGRVATSMVHAAGMPSLSTRSPGEFEAAAIDLGQQPAKIQALKATLRAGRASTPLFDTDRFGSHLETAYRMMWRRHQSGEPPETFSVPRS